jgi:hypothetical protein
MISWRSKEDSGPSKRLFCEATSCVNSPWRKAVGSRFWRNSKTFLPSQVTCHWRGNKMLFVLWSSVDFNLPYVNRKHKYYGSIKMVRL